MIKDLALNTHEIASSTKGSTDWRVAKSLPKFFFDLVADARAKDSLVCRIKGRQTELRASLGNEHLILGHMTGRGMVLCVCDSPRVIWNT